MTTFSKVRERVQTNLSEFEENAEKVSASLPLAKAWINAETANAHENTAISLLKGARLALLETSSVWALGLNRGAAGSLRTFIENVFAWAYYKDHPVEYSLVALKKADIFLPKAVQRYLKDVDSGFDKSYSLLCKKMIRPNEYYYTDLSFFAHAHPAQMIAGKSPDELVVGTPPETSFEAICAHVDEFISDNFAVMYRQSWGAVPEPVKENVTARLATKLPDFLSIA